MPSNVALPAAHASSMDSRSTPLRHFTFPASILTLAVPISTLSRSIFAALFLIVSFFEFKPFTVQAAPFSLILVLLRTRLGRVIFTRGISASVRTKIFLSSGFLRLTVKIESAYSIKKSDFLQFSNSSDSASPTLTLQPTPARLSFSPTIVFPLKLA